MSPKFPPRAGGVAGDSCCGLREAEDAGRRGGDRGMVAKWKIIPHTADLALQAWGDTWAEAFRAAALGMWSLCWDRKRVRAERPWEVEIEASDPEALLVNFLNEWLYLHEAEQAVWRSLEPLRIEPAPAGGWVLRARAWGEPRRPRHLFRREIKAATWHGVRVEEEDGRVAVRVIFDL